MREQFASVTAIEDSQRAPQRLNQQIAKRRVCDQGRFNAQHRAMREGWRDANMFNIQKVTYYHIQQEPVFLHDREHPDLGLGNVVKIEINAEHQAAAANLGHQCRVLILQCAQSLLEQRSDRVHLFHQLPIFLGQLLDCR